MQASKRSSISNSLQNVSINDCAFSMIKESFQSCGFEADFFCMFRQCKANMYFCVLPHGLNESLVIAFFQSFKKEPSILWPNPFLYVNLI